MSLRAGDRLGAYEIIGELGAGGMGIVLRARDTKLDRDVALKVLPADMAADPERLERFQREARAVAALNHPNIVTIYSVEESDGVHFLTMELVEGTTLDAILTDEGLSQARFLELAAPLADAVAAAHAKGITHRDLKPQNVMVSSDGRGNLKVLDFGLARFAQPAAPGDQASQAATTFQTQEGLAVGTVPYMSPEQVEGRTVDARSDIFSLGVMFYEMATGRRPFEGDSSIAVVSSILKDEPSSVSDLKPGFPGVLTEVVRRCLAKDPGARYQDGRALHDALERGADERAGPAPAATDIPWIAVLPFKTRTTDAELEALAEGLTEDITAGLTLFSHLRVVSASSASRYQGPVDVRSVGAELGARFVIEGSLRTAGTMTRVRVQLVDATTGTHLWAEHFDRDLGGGDVFAAQDDLTDRIVATVAEPNGALTRSLGDMARTKAIDTLTADECVLRFYTYNQHVTPDEHAEISAAVEHALVREPDHADAWACLSVLCLDEFRFDYGPRPDSLDRALEAARRAVALDGACQGAYTALAHAHYFRREMSAFKAAAARVESLNPRHASNVGLVGALIAMSGEWATGLALVRGAMRLNPHHVGRLYFPIVWDHFRKQEYGQALEAAERINLPGHPWHSATLASIHGHLGHVEEARTHLRSFIHQAPEIARAPGDKLSRFIASEEVVERIVDGLRKAGLELENGADLAPEAMAGAAPAQPFVGRQAEFDTLVARLDALAGGAGTLVLLGGEPGVGKTRLSEEALAEARQRRMVTLTGHCYEESQAPFAPFVEILEQLLREMPAGVLRDALGEDAADLARLVPKIRLVWDDVPEPAELEPEQQRRVLFNAVLDLLRRLSVRQPVVLLLDDLHWADEATVGLLQHLAPHFSQQAVLGVGTYRDVELDVGKPFEKAMATLVRQKQAVRMPVQRLPETAVAELLTALGGSAPPASLVEAIFQETEGNPFFVGEVFQHLSEEGRLFDEAGAWKSDLTVDELDVPESVRLVVGRRLERLNDATPTLLTAAAVVGRRFDLALLEALGGLDSVAFLGAIEEAEAAKLIASEPAGRETTYVFTHELIRSTLLGALSLPRRQRLHARVAETMEAIYGDGLPSHAAALARHLYEAGAAADETKTLRYLTLAAEQALEAGAFEGALHDVELALSLVRNDDDASRADLLWRSGLARRGLGQWTEATDDWEKAIPLSSGWEICVPSRRFLYG